MLIIVLTVLGMIVVSSVIEGLLHQFILHTPQKKVLGGILYPAFNAHAIEHHPAYRDEHYHREAPDHEKRISLEWYTLPIMLIITSPISWFLWTRFGVGPGLAVPITMTLYYATYETLHWHMHFPPRNGKLRWFENIKPVKIYFDWFDKRHFIHHLADDRNFNVVLPVYDLLTGRYTTNERNIPWAIRLRTAKNKRKSEAIRKARATEPSK
ncbi:MAG: hypothetical protein H0W86_03035 [Armatimonadetes bacterium]|nr:hypothetical protein [Armatimonadota bacterium]